MRGTYQRRQLARLLKATKRVAFRKSVLKMVSKHKVKSPASLLPSQREGKSEAVLLALRALREESNKVKIRNKSNDYPGRE